MPVRANRVPAGRGRSSTGSAGGLSPIFSSSRVSLQRPATGRAAQGNNRARPGEWSQTARMLFTERQVTGEITMRIHKGLGIGVCSLALSALLSLPAGALEPAPELGFMVTGFRLSDEVPLEAGRVDALLAPYRGREVTLDELLTAAKSVEAAIRDQGYAFYRIVLPPQTLTDGEIFLQVVNFKVGNIAIENNRHFSRENILRMLPRLEPGTAPNIDRLAEDVRYANRHPAKRMELLFREGEGERTVDARIRVQDEQAHSVFAILRNTGNEATGKWRLSFGGQHTNVFDRDHVVNITATTSPDKHHHDDVKQIGLSYGIPFYSWGGHVNAFYAKSDVDSGVIENFFDVRGAGHVSGISVIKYLPRVFDLYDHEVQLALEDKHFTNDIRFTPSALVTPPGVGDVRSRPASVKYSLNRETALLRYGAHVQYLANVDGGTDNTSTAYNRVRVDSFGNSLKADTNWQAWRFGGFGNFSLPQNWRFNFDVTGQWTDEALIPGEQFGLGGLASVRGYDERELAGDSGYVMRTELVAPAVFGKWIAHGFYDHGYRDLEAPQGATTTHEWLQSTGLGLRYAIGPLALRMDLAYPLEKSVETHEGDVFLHAYLVWKM